MDNKALLKIVSEYLSHWRADAVDAESYIMEKVSKGWTITKAVDAAVEAYPEVFYLKELPELLKDAAALGLGITEPSRLTDDQSGLLIKTLEKPWTADGVSLSARLHAAGRDMRAKILTIAGHSLKNGADWKAAALALYDGYGRGGAVPEQEIARYMSRLRRWTPENHEEQAALARTALRNINRLAKNGAPNTALKSAYNKLLEAAKNGSEKAFKNALYVAVNEKSRYVAERIARTEAARAWADGFFSRTLGDREVIGYKWNLSSRHPVYDICDLYAGADMYGLGAGIYPKDSVPPLPAHPHCLCYLSEVYRGEAELSARRDNVGGAVEGWLSGQSPKRRQQLLGVYGAEKWSEGESWESYLRQWRGLKSPTSRLSGEALRDLELRG